MPGIKPITGEPCAPISIDIWGIAMDTPYRDSTPLIDIIEDGWCRNFDINQTMAEAKTMGYVTTPSHVQLIWDNMDEDMMNTIGLEY